jgi:hypothetical protein
MLIRYARVSTHDQTLNLQKEAPSDALSSLALRPPPQGFDCHHKPSLRIQYKTSDEYLDVVSHFTEKISDFL